MLHTDQPNQPQPAANQKQHYENYYDALKSLEFSKELDAFNTRMAIKVLSTSEKNWVESVITSALEKEEEAKQIYSIAESIRLEYNENTLKDIEPLEDLLSELSDKEKRTVRPAIDYLHQCIYGIDLFDVAKELLIMYKQRSDNN